MFSRISSTSSYQYERDDDSPDIDSKEQIDSLVDKFRQSSLRKKEKDFRRSKSKKSKSLRIRPTREDPKPERPTCQGLTLRFMKKVFLSESVKVSSKQEQLPAYLDNDFIMKCLVWHNILRSRHQAKPLRLSFDLCHEAQKLANEIAHTDRISYQPKSSSRDIGENLYVKYQPLLLVDSRMDVSAKEVTKHWYHRGVRKYDHSLNPDVLHTQGNNFTQMVWRASRNLGIGKARSIHNEAKVGHWFGITCLFFQSILGSGRENISYIPTSQVIVVAVYQPRGNQAGHFVDNVRPELREPTTPHDSDTDREQDESRGSSL